MDSRVARLQARADGFLFQPFLENIYRIRFLLSDCFLDPEIAKSTHLPFQFIDQIFKCGRVPETGAKPRISNAKDTHAFSVLYPARRLRRGAVQEAPPVKKDGRNSRIGTKRRRRSYRDTPGSPQSAVNRETRETAFGNKKTQFLFHKFRVVSRAFGGTAPNSRAFRVNPKADHARQKQHS